MVARSKMSFKCVHCRLQYTIKPLIFQCILKLNQRSTETTTKHQKYTHEDNIALIKAMLHLMQTLAFSIVEKIVLK